eukprot:scaffold808_cov370-Prasinococcus_capsulatus_cf.AAC.8
MRQGRGLPPPCRAETTHSSASRKRADMRGAPISQLPPISDRGQTKTRLFPDQHPDLTCKSLCVRRQLCEAGEFVDEANGGTCALCPRGYITATKSRDVQCLPCGLGA